eukprot:gnl/Chilomastix_caulleri/551.p1 GENE.gnl/Chilomastix_caulleri/551~~gnl/Chilomastix_caulleri/551.p1  ORF type:complete len:128 (+),score=22.52 gnl/Chilomastix_caulleri/551:44-385(+)
MAANSHEIDPEIEAELNKRQEEAEALGIEFDRLAVKRRIEQERKKQYYDSADYQMNLGRKAQPAQPAYVVGGKTPLGPSDHGSTGAGGAARRWESVTATNDAESYSDEDSYSN